MDSLEFRNISKSFPGVQALQDVSFSVRPGSVHALLGENGAGKSTLLKILSGAYTATSGQIVIDGKPVSFDSTQAAIDAGVAVIYQELNLVPEMSAEENLLLGRMPSAQGLVKRAEMRAEASRLLELVGGEVRPETKVGRLPIAQRQMVEIAKALGRNAKIIAFDEPTSSLSDRETQRLFEIISDLKRQGRVILYVSHRMDEVFHICDSATVLRDGRHVVTFETLDGVTRDQIVNSMVGRTLEDIYSYQRRELGPTRLLLEDIEGPGLTAPTSLEVRSGEIVGLFGLVGAGRTELLKLIFGATPITNGIIQIDGTQVRIKAPEDAIDAGIAFVPEDRKKEGIVAIRSVLENTNMAARRHHLNAGFLLQESWERTNAQQKSDRLRVKTPTLRQLIGNLSGGNQQKVILGRWLSVQNLKVVLLDEPTRGIDVGAKNEIYSILYKLASQGLAILVVSSELPEVLGISDRLLVMRQGKIVGEFERDAATEEEVLRLALPADQLTTV